MADDKKKKEEPTCGCGRPDLYEEMLKQQKKSKDKDADTTTSCEIGNDKNYEDKESEEAEN